MAPKSTNNPLPSARKIPPFQSRYGETTETQPNMADITHYAGSKLESEQKFPMLTPPEELKDFSPVTVIRQQRKKNTDRYPKYVLCWCSCHIKTLNLKHPLATSPCMVEIK